MFIFSFLLFGKKFHFLSRQILVFKKILAKLVSYRTDYNRLGLQICPSFKKSSQPSFHIKFSPVPIEKS